MLSALALSLALTQVPSTPQGVEDPRASLGIPEAVASLAFAPFVDAQGTPQPITIAAAGAGDLDGDGNQDTWFLAGTGSRAGDIAVLTAQTAGLGRFVRFRDLAATPFTAACTLRRLGVPDIVVLADPAATALSLLSYQPGSPDPRSGSLVLVPSTFMLGRGVRALDRFDADGDGCDDLLVTLDLSNGTQVIGTRFVTLHLGMGTYGYALLGTSLIDLPLTGLRARAGDLDGDGRTDFGVDVPGLGVAGIVDDRAGSFAMRTWVGLAATVLRDFAIADFDGDGRDDQALLTDAGAIVVLTDVLGDTQRALPLPLYAAAPGAVALLDADHDGHVDVVALPRSGGNLAVWRFDPLARGFARGEILAPSAPELRSGIGALGVGCFAADLDGDGDRDCAWQIPSGDRWLTLSGTTADFTPRSIHEQNVGTLSAVGFQRQDFTVELPDDLLLAGVQDVEFAVFVEDPSTGEPVYWTRDVVAIAPGSHSITVPVQIMIDPLNAQWVWQSHVTRHPLTGEITAFGNTSISVHGKSATLRFASALASWDGHGQNGPHGSAVGVRWNVVAPPPLPRSDQQLLPWD
ncbi:MAG: VCBS repeat-containing protein [Planctomycetota bacterium]